VAVSGLLKYVTRKPALDAFQSSVTAQVSDTKNGGLGHLGRARLSTPIIKDTLGISIAGFHDERSGVIDRLDPETLEVLDKDIDWVTRWGVSGDLFWQISDRASFRLTGQYQEPDWGWDSWVYLESRDSDEPLFDEFATIADLSGSEFEQSFENYAATFDYEFDFASLTAVTSYVAYAYTQLVDTTLFDLAPAWPDGPPLADFLLGREPGTTESSQFTLNASSKKLVQEVRLLSPASDTLEWLTGIYYADEDTGQYQEVRTIPPALLLLADFPTEYKELAGYGRVTYFFTPDFDLTGGIRISKTSIEFQTALAGAFAGLGQEPDVTKYDTNKDTIPTWSIEARYRPSDALSFYGKAATGYRPSSPNIPLFHPVTGEQLAPDFLESDEIISFELGARGLALDGDLYYEATLWTSEFKDFQTDIMIFNTGTAINFPGSLDSEGIELYVAAEPFDGFSLTASATYTNSELSNIDDSAPFPVEGSEGERIPDVPRWTAAGRAQYAWPVFASSQASIRGGLRYIGDAVANQALDSNGERIWLDGYVLADLDLALIFGSYAFRVFVTNLFDEVALVKRNDLIQFSGGFYTRPRTIGLSFTADF
jgi:outer membrane receptor protein involved in Fe transport